MEAATQPQPAPAQRATEAEYLAFERAAELRHEFVDGEIRAMSGASRAHALILTNLVVRLATQLRDRPGEVVSSGLRLRLGRTAEHLYPDVMVTCGPVRLADEVQDAVENPTLVVEVLSPSTAGYDLGAKAEKYRSIPSLQEYLIVWQDERRVERYSRKGERFWHLTEIGPEDETIELASVGCTLRLDEVYRGVPMEAQNHEPQQSETQNG